VIGKRIINTSGEFQAKARRLPLTSKTKNSRPQVRNGLERREEILKVATDVFYERGFDNGALRDIAKILNITQAALYYHFKEKDEIFFCILDRFTEMMYRELKEELDAPNDPVSVLRSALQRHVKISKDYAKVVKLVIEDRKLLSEPYASRIRVKERKIFDLYRRHYERLRSADLAPPVSPTVITFALLAAANSVHRWYKPDGKMSIEDIGDQLAQLFIGAAPAVPSATRTSRRSPSTSSRSVAKVKARHQR
jgi:AcrR family transcriptional regulator